MVLKKNEKDNITQNELAFVQGIACDFLGCSDAALLVAIDQGEIEELT